MNEAKPAVSKLDIDAEVPKLIVTNAQRLRAHLLKDSLSTALLTAWEAGDIAQAQARMLVALNDFYSPKPAGTHDLPTE